ncbi:HAD family hydrolase [Anaerorhabdus furcosa]|uniref:Phosphoglycolate phosphatase n=1 Tax=Anaerorhabdus furcosa TaxID=118967 RepID=A0A1T4KCL7_9FIRM|nr:HAD hydrolase-like protein [Anaerorhabdus furcosa]SJZ40107.1 phosphoglycolate phosphatase [Anaerorhabdus furcosa]
MKMMIWDWNGTLLNDAECCFHVLNDLCKKRNLKQLKSVDEYRSIFCFPVIRVYQQLGFDFEKESFEDLSIEYTQGYQATYLKYPLHLQAIDCLQNNIENGIMNVLLSASQIDILKKQATEYKCDQYFQEILGLDNIYAHSKVELAKDFISKSNIQASDVVWIGDSVHDFECAKECGTHCILVAQGHQPRHILEQTGVLVVDNLVEAIEKSREL